MLKMIKGANINDSKKINKEFTFEDNTLLANINADKILKIINDFVDLQENPLFLILEVPTHKDNEEVKGNITNFIKIYILLIICQRNLLKKC